MAKRRYLAPWHQEDLMEAVRALVEEGKGLDAAALEALTGKPAIYHCLSRVVDRQRVLGPVEREMFTMLMRRYELFCQVRVLTHSVMSNHFHILLEVPPPRPSGGVDPRELRAPAQARGATAARHPDRLVDARTLTAVAGLGATRGRGPEQERPWPSSPRSISSPPGRG